MQTKHTPAPWAHEEISEGFRIVADLDFTVGIIDCGTIEKMEANAKLIAAAPLILETLVKALEQLDNGFAVEAGMIQEAIDKATL